MDFPGDHGAGPSYFYINPEKLEIEFKLLCEEPSCNERFLTVYELDEIRDQKQSESFTGGRQAMKDVLSEIQRILNQSNTSSQTPSEYEHIELATGEVGEQRVAFHIDGSKCKLVEFHHPLLLRFEIARQVRSKTNTKRL